MNRPLLNEGYLLPKLDREIRLEPIGSEGQAYIPSISGTYRGEHSAVGIESDAYSATSRATGRRRQIPTATTFSNRRPTAAAGLGEGDRRNICPRAAFS